LLGRPANPRPREAVSGLATADQRHPPVLRLAQLCRRSRSRTSSDTTSATAKEGSGKIDVTKCGEIRPHGERARRRAPGGFAGLATVRCACRSLRNRSASKPGVGSCNRPKASLSAGAARGADGRPRGQTRV
jgi:hypothetical protein